MTERRGLTQLTNFPRTFGAIRGVPAVGSAGPDLSDLTATTYSYVGDLGGDTADYHGILLNPDGTKLFVSGNTINDSIAYEMSTPYDPATLSVVSPDERWQPTSISQPNCHRFNSDGTRIIVVASGDDKWYWADLSTAYDLNSAGSQSSVAVPATETVAPTGLAFNADGTVMFLGGAEAATGDELVWKYALSTPYDPSTKGAAVEVLDVSGVQTLGLFGMEFAPDGLKFYSADITANNIDQWNLTIPYDLTTASHQASQTIAAGTNPYGLTVLNNGQIWVSHNITNRIITRWA